MLSTKLKAMILLGFFVQLVSNKSNDDDDDVRQYDTVELVQLSYLH